MIGRRWVADEVLQALSMGWMQRADIAAKLPQWTDKQIGGGLYTLKNREMVVLVGGKWALTAEGVIAQKNHTTFRPGSAGKVRQVRKPEKWTFRQDVWAEFRRRRGKATIPDILSILDGDKKEADNIKSYFLILERAGILTRLNHRRSGDALTSPGYVIWILVDDTGPKAPICRMGKKEVYDPNTGKSHPFQSKNGGGA
ncbi:MAG: hypothetical protein HQM04_06635 [Magnetococcales bacterium]|nr:hypothetical protein [Magnetococcales bacterium]MBF0114703.1 hypothetical protein [Magnetococcales bacterium]